MLNRAQNSNPGQALNRAQGTIEYLVILAIVVVISLVVVGLVMGQMGSASNVSSTASEIKLKTGVGGISVVESVAGFDGNGAIVLKNMGSEAITINTIVVDGVDHNFSDSIVMGSLLGFKLSDIAVCDETKKVYSVKVYFTSGSGLGKVSDFETITIDCTSVVNAGVNFVEEDNNVGGVIPPAGTVPVVYLSSPNNLATLNSIDFNFWVSGDSISSCDFIVDDSVVSTLNSPSSDSNINFRWIPGDVVRNSSHTWDVNCTNVEGEGTATDRAFTNPYELITTTNDCSTLNTQYGYYVLSGNVTEVSETCFLVTANNVTLDGNNFVVTGGGSNYGVDASKASDNAYTSNAVRNITFKNFGTAIYATGANGVSGDEPYENGTPGFNGGSVTLNDVNLLANTSSINLSGGTGGDGYPGFEGAEYAGNGGNGGEAVLNNSLISSINLSGGNGGSGYVTTAGNAGSTGKLNLIDSTFTGATISLNGAVGGDM